MVIRCSWDRDDDIVHMSGHMLGRAHGLANCVSKIREKLGFICSEEKLAGLLKLNKQDQ